MMFASQRAVVALKEEEIEARRAKERQVRKPSSVPQLSAEQKGDARSIAAAAWGVNHEYVSDAKWIGKQGGRGEQLIVMRAHWRIYLAAFRCAASEASRFLATSARRSAPSRAIVRSAERRSFRLCFDDACFDDACFDVSPIFRSSLFPIASVIIAMLARSREVEERAFLAKAAPARRARVVSRSRFRFQKCRQP
jgi:hypothetical protein